MNLSHALFTRNLLMSGVAIVRYIPRAFRVKQVDGNLFFTEEKRQEYRRRVESVTPHSPRQWGTMEVDLPPRSWERRRLQEGLACPRARSGTPIRFLKPPLNRGIIAPF